MTLKAVQFSPRYYEGAKGTPFSEWDTSHDLSIIDSKGNRHRVGQFKHADWAQHVGELIEKYGLPGLE